jgi:hypothetical protein
MLPHPFARQFRSFSSVVHHSQSVHQNSNQGHVDSQEAGRSVVKVHYKKGKVDTIHSSIPSSSH